MNLTAAKLQKNDGVKHLASSLNLSQHPLRTSTQKIKADYFIALEYFIFRIQNVDACRHARLNLYREFLVNNSVQTQASEQAPKSAVRSLVNNTLMPWRRKYRYWLLCDFALVLLDKDAITNAHDLLCEFLSQKQASLLGNLLALLWNDDVIPANLSFAEALINQFRDNRRFGQQVERRIIVTANMSAGKSTIINALMGKPITQTSMEACTGNLCYIYSKPFEDNLISLYDTKVRLNVDYDYLAKIEKSEMRYIASSFRTIECTPSRVCLIDTPGVNSAINREHGALTHGALTDESYDKLIYVFNATRLGTDEEYRYLKYISENVPKDKVIFILNKLDSFKQGEDSIALSIEGVKRDLRKFGFESPVVCPFSAYFALLLKMKHNGETLTEDEQDVYDLYIKKFGRPEYDLSRFYENSPCFDGADELKKMAAICGLYSLERILFGGISQ